MGCGAVQNPQTSQPFSKPRENNTSNNKNYNDIKSPSNQSTQLQNNPNLSKSKGKFPASSAMHSNKQTLNRIYEIKQLLGKGTYGEVYRCINRKTQQQFALKIVKLNAKNKQDALRHITNLKQQISLLKKLNHPNIVKYYTFDVSPDNQTVEIVFQLIQQGSLKDYISKNGVFSQREAAAICKQILEGLSYLHEKSIIHRDLKCANILMNKDKIVKITDFGTAREVKVQTNQDIAKLCASLKGTPYYMAPQILKRSGHHKSADIWSFGCTLIQMLTGKAPWTTLTQNFQQIISYIISGVPPPLPPNISKQCQFFLQSCLDGVPSQRLTAQQLLNHRFITMNCASTRLISPSLVYQKDDQNIQKFQQKIQKGKNKPQSTNFPQQQKNKKRKKSGMYLDSPQFTKKSQPFLNYYANQKQLKKNNALNIKPQEIMISSHQNSQNMLGYHKTQKNHKIKSAKRQSNDIRKVSKTDGHIKMTQQNLLNWNQIQNQMIQSQQRSRRSTRENITIAQKSNSNSINLLKPSNISSSKNDQFLLKNQSQFTNLRSNQNTKKLKTHTSQIQQVYEEQQQFEQVINTALAKQQRIRYNDQQKRIRQRKQQQRRKWQQQLKKQRKGMGIIK